MELTLAELAEGIAATMSDDERVLITGDHRVGIFISRDPLTDADRDIAYGLDANRAYPFVEMIREAHAARKARGTL